MDPRELRDRAAEAFARGRFSKAAEQYERYCAAEPRDLQARLRLGDAWTRAGERPRAVAAYLAAAEGFAREGFLPRAIAASKLVLELDPAHRGVQEMLAGLYARRNGPRPGPAAVPPRSRSSAAVVRPASPAASAPLIPPPPAPVRVSPRPLVGGGPAVDLSHELPPELDLEVQEPAPAPPSAGEVELELTATDMVAPAAQPAARLGDGESAAQPPAAPPGATPVPPPGLIPRQAGRSSAPLPEAPPPVSAAAPPGESASPRPQRDVQTGMQTLARFSELELDLEKLTRSPPPDRPAQEAPAPAGGAALAPAVHAPARSELSEELGASILRTVEMVALAAQGAPLAGAADEETVFSVTDDVETAPLPGQLPHIPLFSDLAPEAFIALFERCPLRRFREGERVIQQGTTGDSFFVICEGRVRVVRQDGGQERELAVLEGGAFFGEVALLSDAPRTASVDSAAEDTQLLEISAAVLTELSQRYPAVAQALKKFCRERLLRTVMSTSALFRLVSRRDRKALVESFRARDVPRGNIVIREGVESDGLYVVLSGEVVVSREEVTLARLKEGDVFGETSLLHKAPATATVTASRRTSLLRLPREAFDALILSHPQILVHVAELSEDRRRQTAELLAAAADEELMLV